MTDEQIKYMAAWHATPQWQREAVIHTLLGAVGQTLLPQIEYAEQIGLNERARYLQHTADVYLRAAEVLGYVRPAAKQAPP